MNYSEPQKKLITAPLTVNLTFGNTSFFKSTLYILITFLAHYNRKTIDYINIEMIKNILFNKDIEESKIFEKVSLEYFPNYLDTGESDALQHTFAFIKNNSTLYGIISYFGVVTYVVKIADYLEEFQNFVVYVNPLGNSNDPNQDMIFKNLESNIIVSFNPELHSEKIKFIVENQKNSINITLNKKLNIITKKRHNNMISEIKSCKSLEQIEYFWKKNRQTIYNKMTDLIQSPLDPQNQAISIIIQYITTVVAIYTTLQDISKDHPYSMESTLEEQIPDTLKLDSLIDKITNNLAIYYHNKDLTNDEIELSIYRAILQSAGNILSSNINPLSSNLESL